ncbi:MAG: tetratricopeptide repeat protein [Bacteroidales bacterium]|nr:tetratricopeptide repeat protein [Bacteroidales bacterium]
MTSRSQPTVPTPDPEKRRVAAENFARAEQVRATQNFDYAIQLFMLCCQIDPANFLYRQALRRTQKEKYDNNLIGSKFAFLSTPSLKAKVKRAKANREFLKVIEAGEEVLCKNPWDLGTQMDMAEAFDNLGLTDLAVFTLDQARQKYPKDPTLNRALARLFEKRGDFKAAIGLWQLVAQAAPTDVEARHKAKDLLASETIARGGYEANVKPADGTEPGIPAAIRKSSGAIETPQDRQTRDTEAIQKRIEADPTEPSLYIQLATTYRRHGAEDRARAALQQGLGPTGNHFTLQLELAELDLIPLRKNLEETEARLKKLKARGPDDDDDDGPTEEELTQLRTRLLREILARETEILRTKSERFPGDLTHRLELGLRLYKLDKPDEAIAEFQQARRDEKLKARASLHLGLSFRRKKNAKLAERNFEDALQAAGTSDENTRKEALYQLAGLAVERGDMVRAVDMGHELANLDFGYKNINKLLDEWESKA